jgi:hypothetical protein
MRISGIQRGLNRLYLEGRETSVRISWDTAMTQTQPTALKRSERDSTRAIKSRRRLVWIVWLSTIPVFGLVGVLGIWRSQTLTVAFMVGWFTLSIFAVFRSNYVRCPRCAKLFNRSRSTFNPWRQSCGNCGLPLTETQPQRAEPSLSAWPRKNDPPVFRQ